MRKRVWLNKPKHHSTAAVYAVVEKGVYELKLMDCDRSVSFAIDGYDADDRDNTLYKVTKLVDILIDFRDALEKEFLRLEKKAAK